MVVSHWYIRGGAFSQCFPSLGFPPIAIFVIPHISYKIAWALLSRPSTASRTATSCVEIRPAPSCQGHAAAGVVYFGSSMSPKWRPQARCASSPFHADPCHRASVKDQELAFHHFTASLKAIYYFSYIDA